MKSLSFYIQGDPKGQPRPRAFARGGMVRVYDPGTAEHWKSQVAIAAKEAGLTEFVGAVSVSLRFRFQRPKSHYRTGKHATELKPSAPSHWHESKPDCDNLAKAVLDALTQLGAWRDDSQVSQLFVVKHWSGAAGCEVLIQEAAE